MASIKIGSLLLKTLAKPIASKIKNGAKENGTFRNSTIALAQFLHRSEMLMRRRLLGEVHTVQHVRPLNDAKAIDSGANFISEGFLFILAATLILAESTRSRRKEEKRRDGVQETLESHSLLIKELETELKNSQVAILEGFKREREIEKIVEEIVNIGLKGGLLGAASPDWESRNEEIKKSIEDYSTLKQVVIGNDSNSDSSESLEEGMEGLDSSNGSSGNGKGEESIRHDSISSSNYT